MTYLESLQDLQVYLEDHFSNLLSSRRLIEADGRIFALEHGLSSDQLNQLQVSVIEAVRNGTHIDEFWLCFVVYLTEVGYDYEGDEYWPVLYRRTPGWEANYKRELVRNLFSRFQTEFGGVKPEGVWAEHFSIISGPITNAVLPKDLQHDLVKVLHGMRNTISSELLEDRRRLGEKISNRSRNAHKRFQQYANDYDLIGSVAASLLSLDYSSGYLYRKTLDRIVADLSNVEISRNRLEETRKKVEITVKGANRGNSSQRASSHKIIDGHAVFNVPVIEFGTENSERGWKLFTRVPNLDSLEGVNSEFFEDLNKFRCKVTGVSGFPKARGWLRYPGTKVVFDTWPGVDEPIFCLDDVSAVSNVLLGELARSPSDDFWLFKLSDDESGKLVSSGLARLGQRYLILTEQELTIDSDYVERFNCAVEKCNAYSLQMPEILTDGLADFLESVGFGVMASISISPVGQPPIFWDDHGYGAWYQGDRILLAIDSNAKFTSCEVVMDEIFHRECAWKKDEGFATLLDLGLLEVGDYDFKLKLANANSLEPNQVLAFTISVREPDLASEAGTFQQPIGIFLSPQSASLEELWNGFATVSVRGPDDEKFKLRVTLLDSDRVRVCAEVSETCTFPFSGRDWRTFFEKKVRGKDSFRNNLEQSDHFSISVESPEFGEYLQRVDREILPLRWRFRKKRNSHYLYLDNNSSSNEIPKVRKFSFDRPTHFTDQLEIEYGVVEDDGTGGLYVAETSTHTTAALVAPKIDDLKDLAPRNIDVDPIFMSAPSFLVNMKIARNWANARASADFFEDNRKRVLDEFRREVCSKYVGREWTIIEARPDLDWQQKLDQLAVFIDPNNRWGPFSDAVLAVSSIDSNEPPVNRFNEVLGFRNSNMRQARMVVSNAAPERYKDQSPASEFKLIEFSDVSLRLLQFVSSPWEFSDFEEGVIDYFLKILSKNTEFVRAARYLYVNSLASGAVWEWN